MHALIVSNIPLNDFKISNHWINCKPWLTLILLRPVTGIKPQPYLQTTRENCEKRNLKSALLGGILLAMISLRIEPLFY